MGYGILYLGKEIGYEHHLGKGYWLLKSPKQENES